ncbi:zeta toxin family protein [Advenella kashmirensis W13003]|uniref:Zeta toxin family protein n=1 Tax=Advenella kashmirensis W13003 TaxID=1424334 RepID=V8QRB4_9BURK|nr:zeta toxin family protein [Advenella kashmirensis]ETF02177.1 zeta toxin family protein [Advenella kashmirensis W13003]
MSAPKLWVVAGPNGAGKTTLTRRHLTGHLPVVNPDDIAAEIDLGHSEIELMRYARKRGFKVILVFVGVDDVGLLMVKSRIAEGGHAVSPEAIERRYQRSMDNLECALQIADRAWVFDNNRKRGRRTLLIREGHRLKYVGKSLPAWALQAIPVELRRRERHIKHK